MQQTCFIHCLGINMSKARSYDVAFRERASRIAKEWYQRNKEKIKEIKARESEERWAAILKNVELMLDYCGFKSPAEVKAARIFLKLGIKNKEEIQKAYERVLR